MKDPTPSQVDAAARAHVMGAIDDVLAAESKAFDAANKLAHLKGWSRDYNAVCRQAEHLHDLGVRLRDSLNEAKQHISMDEMAVESLRKHGAP